jgi:hypothetical protein
MRTTYRPTMHVLPLDPDARRALAGAIIDAARALLESRPGFEPGNYETHADYRRDQRRATAQLNLGRRLLREVEIGADLLDLLSVLPSRLELAVNVSELNEVLPDGLTLHYIAGQYYPTEYRGCIVGWLAEIVARRWGQQWGVLPYLPRVRAAMRRRFGYKINAYL